MPPAVSTEPYQQLRMVWPDALLDQRPVPRVAPGYLLRAYSPGDEPRFCQVMALAGWPGRDDARLATCAARGLTCGLPPFEATGSQGRAHCSSVRAVDKQRGRDRRA